MGEHTEDLWTECMPVWPKCYLISSEPLEALYFTVQPITQRDSGTSAWLAHMLLKFSGLVEALRGIWLNHLV